MSALELAWLRRLLGDQQVPQIETAVASGADTDFYVQTPPITSGTVTVTIDNVPNVAFTVLQERAVRILPAPVAGAAVVIAYERQTFTDAELNEYLGYAGANWEGPSKVYQAAVYAIDSLLMGAATALDFGAGAEAYNMTSVWSRLSQLRALYVDWLNSDSAASDSIAGSGVGALVISEMIVNDEEWWGV